MMQEFQARWWRLGATLVALVLGTVGIIQLFEGSTGPLYKHVLGTTALLAAPILIIVGLAARSRSRRVGSSLIAIGLLPGAAAVVLFWWPPFLIFGLFSIAVIVAAINDAGSEHRGVRVAPTRPGH